MKIIYEVDFNIINFFKFNNTYFFFLSYYLFELPYIYSFYIFYVFLNFLFNKNLKRNPLLPYLFISYIIKYIFYLIFNLTYFSVNNSAIITIKFFNFFEKPVLNNISNRFKNFLLNVIYLSSNITHVVFNSKLYFNNRNDWVFNPPKPILPEFDNIVNKMLRVNNALDYAFASYVDSETKQIAGRYQINIHINNEYSNGNDILALRFTKHPTMRIFRINPHSKYLESENINLNFFCKSITDKNKIHWVTNPVLEKKSDISYYDPDKTLAFFQDALINSEHTLAALSSLVAGLNREIDISQSGKIYNPKNIIEVKTLHQYIVDSDFNLFCDSRFNEIIYETAAFVEVGVQKWGKDEFANILKRVANNFHKATVADLILFLLKELE